MTGILQAPGAIALGFAIAFGGGAAWAILFGINFATNAAQPWSIPAMALVLLALWLYLSGRGWPRSTSEYRSHRLPRRTLTRFQWTWGLMAALSGSSVFLCVLLAGYRLSPIPLVPLPEAVHSAPGLSLAYFAMASAVAGIVEEIGFRGYMQIGLQPSIGWFGSTLVVALLFALFHAAHPEFPSLLPIYVGASICYSLTVRMTGSIWPAVIAHTVADFVSFVLLLWVGAQTLTMRADLAQPDQALQLVGLIGTLSFLCGIAAYWQLTGRPVAAD